MTEQTEIQGSNYDIIRARLVEQGGAAKNAIEGLNSKRMDLFGSTQMTVIGQERIRTEHNCVPQDIVNVGGQLLFGYNIFFGLKGTTDVADVFSLHNFNRSDEGITIESTAAEQGGPLSDGEFQKDFSELYAYFKDSRLHQLTTRGGRLYAAFQVGTKVDDLRVLQWGLSAGGDATYIDNAGLREYRNQPKPDLEWVAITRDDHVLGDHPHVSILDMVFVETVGGDLTVKIENNTEDGRGIYAEPVDDPHQGLGDAEIYYSRLDSLILMKILPYREEKWRYLAYNTLTQSVFRVDSVGQACLRLPEDQGVIFPGGYLLTDGPAKIFEHETKSMRFQEMRKAPNGEDILYSFYRPDTGEYLLLSFNLIRKEVQTPIMCKGYSIFDDGVMAVFRQAGEEATRVHPLQVWQTPYTSDEHAASAPKGEGFLSNLGNAELVHGISDVLTLCRMIHDQQPSMAIYEALIGNAQRILDSYFWLDHDEAGGVAGILKNIISTSELVIDEFQKVQALKEAADNKLKELEEAQAEIIRDTRSYHDWRNIERFVEGLAALRSQRGQLISAKETRFMDVARLDEMEEAISEAFDNLSQGSVDFLLKPEALEPYHNDLDVVIGSVETLENTVRAGEVKERLDSINEGLTLLTEVVGGLQVDDPQKRTQMLEAIGELLGTQNRARAMLDTKTKALMENEGKAEFGVQFQLLGQSVTSSLGMADTPEKCDELLTRTMVQLEELESRFSAFDMFLAQLADKREEIYEVFESKKQTLLEERQRQVQNTSTAAERIIAGVERRTKSLKSVDDLNAYFAADAMVLKVRDLAEKLRQLGDDVAADDIETQLKSSKDQAIRQLRDKIDLFEGGANVIKFGKHRFSVNTQEPELTTVPRNDTMALHITGTQFFEPIDDADFKATARFWDQHLVSEAPHVYRAEFLAASLLFEAENQGGKAWQKLHEAQQDEDAMLAIVRKSVENRYDEGYDRGVHDIDAARILARVLDVQSTAGLLRFDTTSRVLACLFWSAAGDKNLARTARRGASLGRLRRTFDHAQPLAPFAQEVSDRIEPWAKRLGLDQVLGLETAHYRNAARYLTEELQRAPLTFETNGEAMAMLERFQSHLDQHDLRNEFVNDIEELGGDASDVGHDPTNVKQSAGVGLGRPPMAQAMDLAMAWLVGWAAQTGNVDVQSPLLLEAAGVIVCKGIQRRVDSARTSVRVDGLLGQHSVIDNGVYETTLDEFRLRLSHYIEDHVPAYRQYRNEAHELLERERYRLRLNELRPQVLSTFVRNRLIDEVYLPLIGDNLAKQLGAAGDEGRSDRSGLLLLISPPGYGKTTLMEYVASRLGLIFMKINGPSLGHEVVSLDPSQAPNATARQEVEKVNLALEMGNNVMLYVDDIQHTHPEFLQKFISLCDATRRIEGVYKGRSRTYDLRGKRFAVVMAGNPYTESGERFTIPDMLANRADTYNLGDILSGNEGAFEMSYIENSLTANKVTAPLSTRPRGDIDKFMRMAKGEGIPVSELEHPYSSVEAGEIVSVFQKFSAIRDVVLTVNQQYIKSAAMMDEYRTEPPFQLQGSYRNMNKMAEKIASAMNDDEVQRLIDNHYGQEAQTLTTGSEQNLLKLGELRGKLKPEDAQRWEDIKAEFKRRNMLGGSEDDPVARVAGPLTTLVQRLESIQTALDNSAMQSELGGIRESLERAVTAAQNVSQATSAPQATKSLQQTSEAIDSAWDQMAAFPDNLEVKVVGDLPQKLTETLEHQLAIIETALVPMATAIQEHFEQSERTNEALEEILNRLK